MTRVVGHRGAKGIEYENTIRSFKLAQSLGVDAVELDVIATKDGKMVVCHEDNLLEMTGLDIKISDTNYIDLAEIHLRNGETIPLLYDVLALLKGTPIVLDLKTDRYLDAMFDILDAYPGYDFTVTSWHLPKVVQECKRRRPDIPTFIQRYHSPFGLIRSVEKDNADGLNLRYWWLNPITYFIARQRGYEIQVYTVDNPYIARLIHKLYPKVWICTNVPDLMLQMISPKQKQKNQT